MIRIHHFDSEEAVLDNTIDQLIRHIETTRFINPAMNMVDAILMDVPTKISREFKLALSGGPTINMLYDRMRQKYVENSLFQKISYFWINERNLPYAHPESHFGNAYRRFLKHININKSQLHPIPYYNFTPLATYEYTNQLNISKGIQYDPHYLEDSDEVDYQKMITPFASPFHCAIIEVNLYNFSHSIHSLYNDSSDPYFSNHKPFSLEQHISASVSLMHSIPRIIIPILDSNQSYNTRKYSTDIFHRGNISHLSELLRHHPNVNIFTNIPLFDYHCLCSSVRS